MLLSEMVLSVLNTDIMDIKNVEILIDKVLYSQY